MKLTQREVDFIKENIENGDILLEGRQWNVILDKLDTLELDIGYVNNDPNNQPLNDTGVFIERLIDKIAYDDGDDTILEIYED